jgi:preprotein translocase subunit SecA
MRIFGGERIRSTMELFKLDDDTPIEAGILTKSIENAQKKVEAHNYEQRKHVLEYDDVMNKQRAVIYAERRRVLEGHNLRPSLTEILRLKAQQAVDANCPDNIHPHEWDRAQILADMETTVRGISKRVKVEQLDPLAKEEMVDLLAREADTMYSEKEERMVTRYKELDSAGLREALRNLERATMLQIIDRLWIDHLYTMDSLRQGIGLRGWGQKDPRVEYEKEAFELFEDLKIAIQEEFLAGMFQGEDFHIVVQQQQATPPQSIPGDGQPAPAPQQLPGAPAPLPDAAALRRFDRLRSNRDEGSGGPQPVRKTDKKVGRNDPCPCGSGKKYKKCHGLATV